MKPTNQLRFVERAIIINGDVKTVRILQQMWEQSWSWKDESGNTCTDYEWRDVPLEKEREVPVHVIDKIEWPEPESGFQRLGGV